MAVPSATQPPREIPSRWSYGGLAGGVCAISAFGLAAVAVVSNQNSHWLPQAILYGVIAVAFVPAIVVSVIPTRRRSIVLRAETVLSLLLAFGLFAIDPGIAFLLTLPTVLLATASGLIFQGRRTKSKTS